MDQLEYFAKAMDMVQDSLKELAQEQDESQTDESNAPTSEQEQCSS